MKKRMLGVLLGMIVVVSTGWAGETKAVPKPHSVTDSVTQTNVKVLGEAPAVAEGNLYQATSQALSNAAHNATTSQQQTGITAQAATTEGVSTLYEVDTASTGEATAKIFQ